MLGKKIYSAMHKQLRPFLLKDKTKMTNMASQSRLGIMVVFR